MLGIGAIIAETEIKHAKTTHVRMGDFGVPSRYEIRWKRNACVSIRRLGLRPIRPQENSPNLAQKSSAFIVGPHIINHPSPSLTPPSPT